MKIGKCKLGKGKKDRYIEKERTKEEKEGRNLFTHENRRSRFLCE